MKIYKIKCIQYSFNILKYNCIFTSFSYRFFIKCNFFFFFSGPGGWGSNLYGSQNGQDYAYFDTGFAPEHHMQQDGSSQHHMRSKRHRKIMGPTREQKIQIHFNITGREIPTI